jgi:FkbM family methyltransferase
MSINKRIVKICAKVIPYTLAIRLARFFLATQGLGWATDVKDSGELLAAKSILLSSTSAPVIFDVGGNVGEFTGGLLKTFTNASFYIFEPSSSHYKLLEERFLGKDVVRLVHAGLSNQSGKIVLHKEKEITGLATFLDRDLDYLGIKQSICENVQIIKGDNFFLENNIERIDYLKIDVEGWEMPVLEGFEECFRMRKIHACQFEFTSAQIERRENFRDFYRFFIDRGFYLNNIRPDGTLRLIDQYEEILDSYLASNFCAILAAP